MTAQPIARQFVFDTYADLYDRNRPEYPTAMLTALQADGILHPEADVLEVGAGPGQLTAAVAPLVASVTALEPGDHLARLAERRVEGKGNVTVVRSTSSDGRRPRAGASTPSSPAPLPLAGAGDQVPPLLRRCSGREGRSRRAGTCGASPAATRSPRSTTSSTRWPRAWATSAARAAAPAHPARMADEPGRDLFDPWYDRTFRWEVRYTPRGPMRRVSCW